MKRLLFVILVLSSLASFSQQPYLPSTDGTPLNRPPGNSNFPSEGRSQFHDRTNYLWRDYRDTTQVFTTLVTTANRNGKFFIFIHNGGTLNSNGTYTGGTTDAYWFRNGTANSDLTLFATGVTVDTTSLSNRINLKVNISDTAAAFSKYLRKGDTAAMLNPYTTVAEARAALAAGEGINYDPSTGTITNVAVGTSPVFSTNNFKGAGTTPSPYDIVKASNNDLIAAIAARFFGDSLTYGTGGTQTSEFPNGTPYMVHFQAVAGWNFYNYGIAGQTSTQVATRLIADSANKSLPTVIWVGTNNLGSNATILSDLRSMVAALGHNRYLIIDLLGQNNTSSYWAGGSANIAVHALDDSIAAEFPGHSIPLRATLVNSYDHSIPADTLAHFHDVWPPSLGADETHLNDGGYKILAGLLAAKADTLNPKSPTDKIVTNAYLKNLLGSASIGTITPSVIAAKSIGINGGALEGKYLMDGGALIYRQPLNVNGGAEFLYPGSTDGIRIRPRTSNTGGFASQEITGTNLTYWPTGAGITFNNHIRSISIGSATSFAGDITFTGNIRGTTSGNVIVNNGGIYGTSFSVGDPVTHTAQRPVDFTYSGNSMLWPTLSQSQITAKTGSGTLFGEGVFNLDDGHLYSAPSNGAGYGILKKIPYVDDIPEPFKAFGGPGISITGLGTTASPAIFSNTGFPSSFKFSGAIFSVGPYTGSTTNDSLKAFDGNTSTYYQSISNDVFSHNAVGITMDTARVLTSVRVRPADGLTIAGARIQGSNTSTTTGFVDLYTIPSDVFYAYTTYPISNLTPFKYLRLYQDSTDYVLAVSELEFYGYTPTANITLTTNSGAGPTLVGNNLNIPPVLSGTFDTTSLSRRIDSAFSTITFTSDSSSFTLHKKNGDSTKITFVGSAGSSSGSAGVTSLNGNTGALTLDTTYITNFAPKVRSLFTAGTGISIVNGVISATGGAAAWGSITGTLSTQSDLATALGLKGAISDQTWTGTHTFPATTTGITAAALDSSGKFATTAYVDRATARGNVQYYSVGQGTQSIKSITNIGDTAKITYRSFIDNTGAATATLGDTGIIVGNVHLNAANAFTNQNTFTNSSYQTIRSTTAGNDGLRIYGPSGSGNHYFRFGEDAYGNREFGTDARMNITGGAAVYISAGSAINLKNSTTVGRIADATSTGTASNSYDLTTEISVWNGSAGVLMYHGFRGVASTSTNGLSYLALRMNGNGNPDLNGTGSFEFWRTGTDGSWKIGAFNHGGTVDSAMAIAADGTVKKQSPSHTWSGTPSITIISGGGTGATISVTGNDVRGTVTLTTGTGTITGCSMTMTFATAYASTPFLSGLVSKDATTGGTGIVGYCTIPSQTFFGMPNALAASTTYTFTYHIDP